MIQRFFELPVEKLDLPQEERGLYRMLFAAVVYIPVMQFMIGISIIMIGLLNAAGLFDQRIPLLFAVAFINILDAVLHVPLFPLLRQGRLGLVAILLTIINGTLSATQIYFWNQVIWFPVMLILSAVFVFILVRGLSLRVKGIISVIGIILVIGTFFADGQISYARLQVSNLAANAALALYFLLTLAMLALGLLNSIVNFQTISNRLVSIFTTATILIILVMMVTVSLTNYLDSRQRTFQQLEAITNLKVVQINSELANLQNQASQPIASQVVAPRMQYLLSSNPNDLSYRVNLDLVRSYLNSLKQQTPGSNFLLVDSKGQVIAATNRSLERNDFSSYAFLQSAQNNIPFVIEKSFPGAQQEVALLVLSPLRLEKTFLGVIVLQTDFNLINEITQTAPGINETFETYLVSKAGDELIYTTSTNNPIKESATYPTEQAFSALLERGIGIYPNYAGATVLGNFVWIPEIQSILVSEIDQREVLANITNSLYINLSIGLVMILLSLTVVSITSQSISRPIQDFAEKATTLASGDLSTRIAVARQDEIGVLASSFNMMASELETIVRQLETKVEERTKDLQKQANYMRIAAEVARDATIAQDPDELLNRAAQLILDRFNFYHTGLFLIDSEHEFAVLRASPTEAGKKMLERGHKLRLGQVGIVGYVAATGTPRIVLDTGQDAAFFNNPLLPNTRSEIAIPLKLDDKVIGVLDVQSNQPEAFTQDDISVLQIMADQLALAIQRVELVKNLQRNLEELENTYQAFTVDSWRKFSQEPDFKPGYQFDGVKITPLNSFPAEVQKSLLKGRITAIPPQRENEGAMVAIPLKLRDQDIGILMLRFQTTTVEEDMLNLIEDIAGRLAVALENARLYAETQNLVQRERAVSEISNRITTSFNIENILRTTVMEIGKMMPDAEVVVQLEQNKE